MHKSLTLHCRDGRTFAFRRHAVLNWVFLSTDEGMRDIEVFVNEYPPTIWFRCEDIFSYSPRDKAESYLDPDYIEFPDGSRFVWPQRKDATDGN